MSLEAIFTVSFNATKEEVAEWGRKLHAFPRLGEITWRNGRANFQASTKRGVEVWEFLHGIGLETRAPKGVYETEDGFTHKWGE